MGTALSPMPATKTEGDDTKLDAWRAAKVLEWNDESSKLRQKYPTRAKLDAWLKKQCQTALRNASVARAAVAGPDETAGPVVSLRDVHFTHTKYCVTPVLHGVSFDLLDGQVVGMFGLNEAGKSTIAKLITRELKPDSGVVEVRGRDDSAMLLAQSKPAHLYATFVLFVALLCASVIELSPVARMRIRGQGGWLTKHTFDAAVESSTVMATGCSLLGLIFMLWWHRRQSNAASNDIIKTEPKVVHITSEDSPGASFTNQQMPLLEYITELMPGTPDKEAKRHAAQVTLELMNFQMFDQGSGEAVGSVTEYLRDGVTLEQCSGGQKQIVYTLRMLMSQPDVLVCDEALSSLDQYAKARLVLYLQHLVQTKQIKTLLFISCDLNAFPFIAHSLVYLHKGLVDEQGTTKQVMTKPAHKNTRDYVTSHALVTPSGKDLAAMAENMEKLKDEVLAKARQLHCPPK